LAWHSPPATALIVIFLIWTFIVLIVSITASTQKGYYGDTQYWCWITSDYPDERIALEYLWLFVAAFANIIIYVFLALVIKGVIVVERFRVRFPTRDEQTMRSRVSDHRSGSEQTNIGLQLLYYPVVYTITVTPIAIARFMAFSGYNVPFAATAFADCLFSSSGFFNVILFKITRPKLIPSADLTLNSFPVFQMPTSPGVKRSTMSDGVRSRSGDDIENGDSRTGRSAGYEKLYAYPVPLAEPDHDDKI